MASTDRSLHFSDSFVISCGTVTVDLARSKALLIRSRGTGECYLPKGRKDVSESLPDAALRETFEETGVRARLLPVPIATHATTSQWAEVPAAGEEDPRAVTEPIAVAQRVVTGGVLKIIFWFVAAADSTAVPEEGTQQEGEDFETVWADFGAVGEALTFEDDRRIAQAGIVAVLASVF